VYDPEHHAGPGAMQISITYICYSVVITGGSGFNPSKIFNPLVHMSQTLVGVSLNPSVHHTRQHACEQLVE
jgi:hypothetical protein